MNTKEKLAYALAEHAHAGQKYGEHDYFHYHVLGVAKRFSPQSYNSDAYITALLHDVVEDSGIHLVTIRNLFGSEIADSIEGLTKTKTESYDYYINQIRHRKLATKVKIADLKFHLSQPDKGDLHKRYRKALKILEVVND